MSNKEKLHILNQSHNKLLQHSKTIENCGQQIDELLSRLDQIKTKIIKKEGDVSDDFKELHQVHIQNTQYIEKLELYENEALNFKHKVDTICGKPLSDPIWFQQLKKKYLNQCILYELYRQGRFKAAELFVEEAKIKKEPTKDKEKFIQMHQILYAMDQFDIKPALKLKLYLCPNNYPCTFSKSFIVDITRWITQNQTKEAKENEEKNEEDNHNNSKHKSSTKDINFNQKYKLSKHADILKFLLHRDKFLHISAVGSKQEMHNYMRQELEKLRNAKYDNPYSQEIINNLHYESQSIAYYVDDWKFLYYLKMFPNKKVYEIPVNLQKESLEKYAKIIQQCQEEKDEDDIKNDNDIQEEDNNNDVEMNGNKGNDDMTNIERKRKNMNDSNHTDKPSVVESSNKNNNDAKSPRKKRKTLERKPKHDNGYNTAQLCMDQDYLTYDQKSALFEAFEFTTLIESVWNLSRKAFITAFINIELDLPSMSGLQSCVELGWSILPQFKELPDDLDTDFDETLSLYKDFNKEKQVRSRAPFPGSLLSHHNANNSDDDAPIQNGLGLAAMNTGFKWEDYDTLEDDSSSDEDENGVSIVDPIPDNDRRMKNRELPHVPQAVRRGTGSYQGTPLGMAWDPMTVVTGISQSGGNKNDSDDEKKQQKSRFRVHSDDGDNDKSDTPKKSQSNDGDDSKMDQDEDDEDDQVNVPQEPAYGEYDEVGDDLRAKEEVRDSDNYIGYINRKEFKLDMKKRRIIRRSKTKEYRDRIDKYGTCDFLYTQIKDYIDPPNKKKRSKHKFQRPTTILLSSNRSRTQRYESRGVQRPHSLPSSSQRHRSLRYSQSASPANPPQSSLTHLRVHHSSSSNRNNPNNTPPPASDSSDHNDNESNIFNNSSIISSLHRQINIPNIPSTSSRLPRPARPSQHSSSNDNERRSQHQHPRPRIYPNISSQIHRSVQAQFSPPPSNHAPNLLLDTGNLLASRGVNEEQDNNEVRGDFEYGDLSVLNPSIFASRSSSPLSSQLIEHLSMTNHASSQTQSVDDNNSGNNNNKETDAAAALVKLSKSGDSKMSSKDDDNKEDKSDNHNRNKGDNKENDDDSKMNDKSKSKMELDNDDGIDAKSSKLINTPQSQTKLNMSSIYIDWENESDSSEDEERYFTKKDKDMVKNEERRLKISTKMSDDFKIPEGYMAHSIFVCPISSDYAPDPQARLSCGHLVSCSAFAKLQTIKRSRQHEANRNRGINIHCPICDTPCDSEKDVRFVYLGRFPNLKVDSRFSDILEKELDAQARKWIPGNSIAAKE